MTARNPIYNDVANTKLVDMSSSAGDTINPALLPPSTPGGLTGQIQYNHSGVFGGFDTNGDATINVVTGALTIANNAVTTVKLNNTAVTLAKIQNATANSKILGSGAAGSGASYSEITLGTGLSMSGTTLNSTASGGTVTSVNASGGTTGLSFSGGPITTSGTLTLAGTLAIANGGTGQVSASAAFNALSPITTAGDLVIGNGANSNTRLAIGTSGQLLTSNGTTASWQAPSLAVPGYIYRLELSAAGGTGTFSITIGSAVDSTNIALMTLPSAFTKTTAAWSVGSGNGALDTGTIANAWYHVFIIAKAGGLNPDILISTNISAPTLPATYTLFRRIGSMLSNASHFWIQFVQIGSDFLWFTPMNDVNAVANPGTAAVTRTLSVPPGVVVKAYLSTANLDLTTAGAIGMGAIYLSSLNTQDVTPSLLTNQFATQLSGYVGSNTQVGGIAQIWTNTSGQIRSRCQTSSATLFFYISTYGWMDPRL